MKASFILLISFLFPGLKAGCQPNFNRFCEKFVTGYQSLHIPELQLSYVAGFQDIGSVKSVDKQAVFFNKIENELHLYHFTQLTHQQQQDYLQIQYEAGLNLRRLALEKRWLAHKPATIPANGLFIE